MGHVAKHVLARAKRRFGTCPLFSLKAKYAYRQTNQQAYIVYNLRFTVNKHYALVSRHDGQYGCHVTNLNYAIAVGISSLVVVAGSLGRSHQGQN